MKKIFIDCGFHHGEGLAKFIEVLSINQDWLVHAFEPNPACNGLERINAIGNASNLKYVFHPLAVWTHDGMVEFSQEDWTKSRSGSQQSDNPLDGWASCLTELNNSFPGLCEPLRVPCRDFSHFLLYLHVFYFGKCEIYCKMDIEGAEFAVLRKLLRDGRVKYLKKIWIEFHERYIPKENRQTKAALIRELSLYTEVEEWD